MVTWIRRVVVVLLVACVVLLVIELPKAIGASMGVTFFGLLYVLPSLVVIVPGLLLMRRGGTRVRLVVWAVATVAIAWVLGLIDPDLVHMVLGGQPVPIDMVTDPLALVPALLMLAAVGGVLIAFVREPDSAS